MRLRLIIFFCAISFPASAQFWQKIGFKKKHDILPELQLSKNNSISHISNTLKLNGLQVQPLVLEQCEFSLEVASVTVMEMAKHNMRFRIYNDASYNFSDLAQIYIKLHRLSEAKWYLLQSNNISRQENDDKHTISNLINLAAVKVDIGDMPSAKADLLEARDMARAKVMQAETAEIEKKILLLAQNNTTTVKPDVKYAESAGSEKKAL
ncbi:hypothetical protein ACPPVU_00305 [Mucilaginibacter sp. McL0603]|uniref:hypothetical protein n=1 Tax=Mucilaginibacter sp. McL0603 TaxID=3415670 RepID=UPI003CF7E58E